MILNTVPLSEDIIDYIRLRPGMYIGDMGTRGKMHIFKDLLKFSYHYIENWKTAHLSLSENNQYTFSIEGQLTKYWSWKRAHIAQMDNDHSFYGLVQLIALSSSLTIRSKEETRQYKNGKLIHTEKEPHQHFSITFELDSSIFKEQNTIALSLLTPLVERFCAFHPSKGIYLKSSKLASCIYSQGLVDLFKKMAISFELLTEPITIDFIDYQYDFKCSIVLAFRSGFNDLPFIHLYANQELMVEGGTPADGFLKGWRNACAKIIQDKNAFLNHRINLVGLVSIESPNITYAGSVKQKVDNPQWYLNTAQHTQKELLASPTFIAALNSLNVQN